MTLLWMLLGGVIGMALCLLIQRVLNRRRSAAPAPREQDKLTGLPTPQRFEQELTLALDAVERNHTEGCLLAIGFDNLRLINDEHGKAAGDAILVHGTERLRTILGADALLARLGGDEFAAWLPQQASHANHLARTVMDGFHAPFQAAGQSVPVSVSIGLATAPTHGTTIRLLKRAQMAMHAVQRLGGNAHALFDTQQEEELREEMMLARELRHAVARDQLELLYQPKMDARTLQITAVEALIRWRHPTLGVISPARFIPIAERYGFIHAIGDWVVDAALSQAARWRDAGLRMRVAINVSGFQLRKEGFAAHLEKGLRRHRLRPERFTCEITESVAMEDTATTERAFRRLGELGVHVSIDDFGTGYSSLASLRKLPAQELKIDRAFVADLAASREARAIVQAVIDMARTLNLKVVAEGVETVAQRDQLGGMGCDELQGYLFAKPMSARAIEMLAAEPVPTYAGAFRPSLFKDTAPVPISSQGSSL